MPTDRCQARSAARRLRVTWVAEYPARPIDYNGECDPEKMAALDQQSVDEGDLVVRDFVADAATVEIRIEVAR